MDSSGIAMVAAPLPWSNCCRSEGAPPPASARPHAKLELFLKFELLIELARHTRAAVIAVAARRSAAPAGTLPPLPLACLCGGGRFAVTPSSLASAPSACSTTMRLRMRRSHLLTSRAIVAASTTPPAIGSAFVTSPATASAFVSAAFLCAPSSASPPSAKTLPASSRSAWDTLLTDAARTCRGTSAEKECLGELMTRWTCISPSECRNANCWSVNSESEGATEAVTELCESGPLESELLERRAPRGPRARGDGRRANMAPPETASPTIAPPPIASPAGPVAVGTGIA
eukprot:CAMPEP_0179970204 /NCGR_PEP_ID=MMETSP0983-20121128/35146_1 /TAXON_ID=483367 /ORGANISM="non described non described, Strain CCMP 2436" /LENGTH=287 /DNA_ID=CAMNT_0021884799 /DNA_START=486 /DNA_END=1346 /DNA_ORIENTATION=+